MSSRSCGVPPSGRPFRVIPGSSFSARPKRSTFRGCVPTVSDRFTIVRSVHSAFRTLFPATPTSGPSSRPTRDRSPTTPFRTVSRNRRGGRVPPVSSSGVIQEPSHHSEAFHHFGVVPSFRSHSDAVPSFRCHFTDKKSPIVSKSFSHSKVDFVQPIRRPVDGPSSQ